ncbi:MAG: FAD:protein FMN transferase [Actinomycetota bacterium]|nr:FAD:protein FMN transferase [Actinomycetota bacterium]
MNAGPQGPADERAVAPDVHRIEPVMGTVVVVDIYTGGDPVPADVYRRLARARAVLHRADAVFSTWKRESPVSRLRRGEVSLEETPPDVREVLELCASARDATGGWFDPWAMPGGVDPTGYVKGWAAQKALDALVGSGVTGALVNAAGDIACSGSPSPGGPWRIAVADPSSRAGIVAVAEVTRSIATSGTYERGAHLVDPRTGLAGTRVASATVTGPDLGRADALATALAVGGDEVLPLVGGLEGYEGLTVQRDGTWSATPAFPFAAGGTPDEVARLLAGG